MSVNPLEYDYEWAPIVALIAAAIALYGAWRANKIAEKNLALSAELEIIKFREQWIQRLREEMAEYAGVLLEKNWNSATIKRANLHTHKIQLHLNSMDELHNSLISQIQVLQIRRILETYKNSSLEAAAEKAELIPSLLGRVQDTEKYSARQFMKISAEILKTEWERLKKDLRDINAKNK